MSEEKYTGVVTKIIDYKDFDQVITMVTDNEVIPFIALGVRKITSKNRIALQLGNIIEVELFRARLNGKLSKVKRANLIKQAPIQELDTANVLFTVLKHISQIEVRPRDTLRSFLEVYSSLGTEFNHHAKVYILTKFLKTVGQYPTFNGCVECGSYDHINGFEFYLGGFTCKNHSPKKRELSYLKGVLTLDKSFVAYKETNAYINKMIYKELEDFIKRSNW